jgi:phosphonate transport system substrate-binding protein
MVANSYATVIEALKAKKIHMGQLSPYPYLLARDKSKVTALFYMGKKDGNPTGDYKSCMITRKSSGLKTLDDIKSNISKLTLGFVDPASSSGHIIPHYFLRQNGIDPEKDFKKVVYTNNHPACILTLYSGKIDVACTEMPVLLQIRRRFNNVSPDSFNVVWTSTPIPPTAYCIRNDISPLFKKKVLEAYMNANSDTAAWGAVKRNRVIRMQTTIPLDSLGYVPVDLKIYDEFAKMVKGMKDIEIK